jgi:PPP family 3-phenylpropionic acid transporter
MIRFSIHYFVLFTVMAIVYPYFQMFLRARGFSDAQVGYLQGFVALAGVCGPLLIGYIADRTGRRRALTAFCLIAFAALVVPLNRTSSFWLAAALVAGVGFTVRTTIPLTDTLAATQLPDPIHQYGRVRIWGSIGFIVALVGIRALRLVDDQSSSSMAAGMLVATGICLLSTLALLREGPPAAREHRTDAPASGGFDSVFWLFVLATGLHQWGMSAYYSFFTMYLHDRLGMANGAWVWAIGSAAEVPLLFFGGRIIRRFGLSAMLRASMAAVALRLGIIGLAPTLWVVLPSQVLHAMTFGVFHAASIEFLRRKVPSARRGLAMALYMSLALALPGWIASSLGGVVIEHWGYAALYLSYTAPPLLGIALLNMAGERINVPA